MAWVGRRCALLRGRGGGGGGGEPCHYREGECELLKGVGGKAVWIIKGEGGVSY